MGDIDAYKCAPVPCETIRNRTVIPWYVRGVNREGRASAANTPRPVAHEGTEVPQ